MKNLPGVVSYGSHESVRKVLQQLKMNSKWDPKSDYASQALKIAFSKEITNVCVLLVEEGIPLTKEILSDFHCQKSIGSIIKVIECLRKTNKWDPKSDIASETLKISLIKERNDVFEQLFQEGVKLTMSNLPGILYNGSRDSIIKAIQYLKDNGKWGVTEVYLSETLIDLLRQQRYDVYDILIQQGVMLKQDDLCCVVEYGSIDSVIKSIQHLKDIGNWNPGSHFASNALTEAYVTQKYDICDLLVHERITLSVRNLSDIMYVSRESVSSVKRAIQYLKDTNNWYTNFEYLSTELENAYRYGKYSLCDLLVQEGVSLSMKNLPGLMDTRAYLKTLYLCSSSSPASFESVSKAIQHLKNANNWDSNSCYAITALENACEKHMFDVSNLLCQEGVSFTMKNLLDVISVTGITTIQHQKEIEFLEQKITHLKNTDAWDPSSEFVTQALEKAFSLRKYDVINLLLQEYITPNMKMIPEAVCRLLNVFVTDLAQQIKIAHTLDPPCHLPPDAQVLVYYKPNYEFCFDLLFHENITPTMNIFYIAVSKQSIEFVKKLVERMKIADTWDPLSYLASDALELALQKQNCNLCKLLIHEKVKLKMNNLPGIARCGSIESITKAIQHLKDARLWDPSSPYASEALEAAFGEIYTDGKQKCEVSDLLIQEGVSLSMTYFETYVGPYKFLKKVIDHLKDKGNWDPHSKSAAVVLQKAYLYNMDDVCGLLIQEGILPTMEHLLFALKDSLQSSMQSVSKVVQHLKDTGSWNPHCEIASVALKEAYLRKWYGVCDLLMQEGILLTMENLLHVVSVIQPSLGYVSMVVQDLKDNGNWDPSCESASAALQHAYKHEMKDICDLLIQEGISPKKQNLLYSMNDSWQF